MVHSLNTLVDVQAGLDTAIHRETSTHCYLYPHGEQPVLQAEVCRYLDRCVDAHYQNDVLVDLHRDSIWILCQWLITDDGCVSDPLT